MFNTANSDLVLLKLSLIFFAVYAVNDRVVYIDIERNYRLLQVCYAPTTSAKVLAFFAASTNSTNETSKAGSTCH